MHTVVYKNVDDLSEKLNYFRENDSSRKKIARKGQEKYFRCFNSNLVANYIIEKTFNFKSKQNYLWE